MAVSSFRLGALISFLLGFAVLMPGATTLRHYYGHDAVEDADGVIAPWYRGQNGQFDLRVRIAAETMKRYPWVGKDKAVLPGPEFIFNGTWNIDQAGTIKIPEEKDWANGDVGQRAAYLLRSMMEYYRYSGDPAAWPIISGTADYLVGHCETDSNHAWPKMLISVPNMGVRYGDCRVGPERPPAEWQWENSIGYRCGSRFAARSSIRNDGRCPLVRGGQTLGGTGRRRIAAENPASLPGDDTLTMQTAKG